MPSRYMRNYPSNWKKVSLLIRALADGHCQNCGELCEHLSVHHIGVACADGRPGDPRDKHDLRRENLIALCFTCHDSLENIRVGGRTRRLVTNEKVALTRRLFADPNEALCYSNDILMQKVFQALIDVA